MGKRFEEAWADFEGDFGPAFEQVANTGTSFSTDHARFYLERQGYFEETYYSVSLVPIPVGDDQIAL